MIYFFIIITVTAVVSLIALFSHQAVVVSSSDEQFATESPDVHKFIGPVIDYLTYRFVAACRDAAKSAAVFCLSAAREIVLSIKHLAGMLEHRFSHLINLVRGRGIPGNRGSVSFFLKEIDEYKKTATSQNQ